MSEGMKWRIRWLRIHKMAMLAMGPVLFLLATAYRRLWVSRCRVIVVVGSFGKSTTATTIAQVLGCQRGGENAQPWLAMGVLALRRRHSRAVFEAGISRKRQMWPLAVMLRPDTVVVTSIGSEHREKLGSLAVTRAEKARMVEALGREGLAVLNGDDPDVMWMTSRTSARVVTCGREGNPDVRVTGVSFRWPPRMVLSITHDQAKLSVSTRLVGHSMIFPLAAALAVAREEGVPEDDAIRRMARVKPLERRMEPLALTNGAWGILDDRKALPETISLALKTIKDLPTRRRWAVLGEIGGPAGYAPEIYRRCARELAHSCDRLVLVALAAGARDLLKRSLREAGVSPAAITVFAGDLGAAANYLRGQLHRGDVVLFKGRFGERVARIALSLSGLDVKCWISRCEPRRLHCLRCPALLSPQAVSSPGRQ